MNGFNRAIDGYYEVEDQLPHYLRGEMESQLAAHAEERNSLSTPRDYDDRHRRVRQHFLDAIGGLPTDRTPLNPSVECTLNRDGYVIEKTVFESLPNFHVTSNVYVPEDELGPHPGILFLCGHSNVGKASEIYQKACIDLVRAGFVVLTFDPIGQGERHQCYDPDTGALPRENVTEHAYLGQKCMFTGSNLARYFLWDCMRALDYLASHSDVDETRLGATGNSGGGMQTAHLMLTDDRLAAAVPTCWITAREDWLKTGQSQDDEQYIYQSVERGPLWDDFISSFAPKPALIGGAQSDYFCIEGAERTYRRAKQAYEVFGVPEKLDLAVSGETHGLNPYLREEMITWFLTYLQDRNGEFQVSDPEVEDPETLWCTPRGEVKDAYADEVTVIDLNQAYIHDRISQPQESQPPGDGSTQAVGIRDQVIRKFDLDRKAATRYPRTIATRTTGGLVWEKIFFFSEPDIIVTGIIARRDDLDPDAPLPEDIVPTIVLLDFGTTDLQDHRVHATLSDIAGDRGIAMAFDPRGLGAVRSRDVNSSMICGNDYFAYMGTEYKLAYDAFLMGSSLIGMRIFDILQAREYLADRYPKANSYGITGMRVGAVLAMYAAAAEESFERIDLVEPMPSFYELAVAEGFEIDPRLNLYDVVGTCDAPQLVRALANRTLTVNGLPYADVTGWP